MQSSEQKALEIAPWLFVKKSCVTLRRGIDSKTEMRFIRKQEKNWPYQHALNTGLAHQKKKVTKQPPIRLVKHFQFQA